jgi:cytochrome d ubiquinol oxidase subunit I
VGGPGRPLEAGRIVARLVLAEIASAFFVVSANAWMNQPRGFDLTDGRITGVDPWAAMFNPATPPETIHMILAALMVTGFLISSVYAVGISVAAATATTGSGC